MKTLYLASDSMNSVRFQSLLRSLVSRGYKVILDRPCIYSSEYADVNEGHLQAISSGDAVVVQITKPNEIVDGDILLAIGYAVGVGKPVVLLSNDPKDVPLSLRGIRFVDISQGLEDAIDVIGSTIGDPDVDEEGGLLSESREKLLALSESGQSCSLTSDAFERLVGAYFESIGFEVYPGQSGFGSDFLARSDRGELLVEARWSHLRQRVGIPVVQQIIEESLLLDCAGAVVVANGAFTLSARGFAKSFGSRNWLLHPHELASMNADDFFDSQQSTFDETGGGSR